MPTDQQELDRLIALGIAPQDAIRLLAEREAAKPKSAPKKAPTDVDLALAIMKRLGKSAESMNHQESVNVTAQRPQTEIGGDEGLGTGRQEAIVLGSASQRPTGVYLPPTDKLIGPEGTNLSPNVKKAWDETRAAYPYVSRYVADVDMKKPPIMDRIMTKLGIDKPVLAYMDSGKKLHVNPDMVDAQTGPNDLKEVLAHELTHITQKNAFPTSLDFLTKWVEPLTPYEKKLAEQQAFATQFDIHFNPKKYAPLPKTKK